MPFFSYITLQNFYTHAITIKQFVPPAQSNGIKEDLKVDKNWVSVLKNYQLMKNAHFENDAQNWHMIGVELVSDFAFCLLTLTVTVWGFSSTQTSPSRI